MKNRLLHVGCSHKHIDRTTKGFNDGSWHEIRLDIDPTTQPDIVGTMTDMSGVESCSVNAIFSSHNIEHLYPHEVPVALKEFQRVLQENGFCVITCPDLKSVCKLIAEDKLADPAYVSSAGPITPLDILYGYRKSMMQGNLYMAHHCGFTEKVLRGTLLASGFKSIATMCRPSAFDLWALACKEELEEPELNSLAKKHFPER